MQTFVKAIALGIGLLCPMVATAQDVITYEFDGSFEDGTFALENAIIDRGLVIDYVSHVGEMLARTGADVGSDVEIFNNADIYLFCSAAVSRRVMEADPMNIVHCPYSIFVADMGDGVVFGHRAYPDGPMQEVEAMLDAIIIEAREQ
ncbi:DUF302 domain-containing protein [Gymnodinialimonas phycosphaerae]